MAVTKKSKSKVEEPIALDDTILMIASALLNHISKINIEVTQHINKKTVIVDEKVLNEYISASVRLAGLKEVKRVYVSILDNDILEIEVDIQKFEGDSKLKKQIKISDISITKDSALFKYKFEDIYNTKNNNILEKIIVIFTRYIVKNSFTDEIFKKFSNETSKSTNEEIEIDLKEDFLSILYNKTINEIMITPVPFFGNKKVVDMFNLESVMCEKGQIWIDYVFKIS